MKRGMLPAVVLFLGSVIGCGGYDSVGLSDKNSTEARRYEILKAIDVGNYDYVIQILSSDLTYGGAFTQDEGRMNLAAAYVGKAGFDISEIVAEVIEANRTADDFKNFVKALSAKVGTLGTLYLSKASDLYRSISPGCNPAPSEDIKKDACFYKGVVDIAAAAVGIMNLVSDIEKWLSPQGCSEDANQNGVGDEADASACAIEYGVNGSCTVKGANLISVNSSLTFTDRNNYTYTFELVRVEISGTGCSNTNPFYRLIEASSRKLAVTEGFCDTNFQPCSAPDPGSGCYPCPIVDEGNALDVTENIVNTMESSLQAVESLVQGTEAEQAVRDFITEVCGADEVCSDSELASYLSSL